MSNIVHSKEYIAGNKVMRRVVLTDGSVRIDHIRDVEFKDVKTFPALKKEEPVVVIEEKKEQIVIKEEIKVEPIEEEKPKVKNDEIKDLIKNIDKRKKKKAEEVILPKEEELATEDELKNN